jgi:hypothetical protein
VRRVRKPAAGGPLQAKNLGMLGGLDAGFGDVDAIDGMLMKKEGRRFWAGQQPSKANRPQSE